MHEHAIAQEIIKQAKAAAKGKPLRRVTIQVGEVAHLPPHEMREVLQSLLRGVDIKVREKPAKVRCACGYEGRPAIIERGHDHNVFKCPKCGAMMPKVIDGEDIILVSIDV